MDPAMFHGEDEDERIPSVAESLERGGIFHDVGGGTREEALRSIIALLKLDDEGDREPLLHLLLARDAAVVVPVGDGIAIPHVRTHHFQGSPTWVGGKRSSKVVALPVAALVAAIAFRLLASGGRRRRCPLAGANQTSYP